MQQVVSKSQFKAQALEYLRSVEKQQESVVITHNGRPVAKVVPYKESKSEDLLQSLKGSVLSYKDPAEPVGLDDWDMLK